MNNKIKKRIYVVLIFAMILSICLIKQGTNIEAKMVKKNGTYSATNSLEAEKHFGNRITKLKYKGKNVVFKGAFYYFYTTKEGYNCTDMVKGKNMTFSISKKCKFYNYDTNKKISRKAFKKATSPIKKKVGVKFVVKGGKIVKMWYSNNNSF